MVNPFGFLGGLGATAPEDGNKHNDDKGKDDDDEEQYEESVTERVDNYRHPPPRPNETHRHRHYYDGGYNDDDLPITAGVQFDKKDPHRHNMVVNYATTTTTTDALPPAIARTDPRRQPEKHKTLYPPPVQPPIPTAAQQHPPHSEPHAFLFRKRTRSRASSEDWNATDTKDRVAPKSHVGGGGGGGSGAVPSSSPQHAGGKNAIFRPKATSDDPNDDRNSDSNSSIDDDDDDDDDERGGIMNTSTNIEDEDDVLEENNAHHKAKVTKTTLSPDDKKDRTKESGKEEGDEEGDAATRSEASTAPIILYKSTRLKGYITLCFSSSINYNAASKADDVASIKTVPPTLGQQQYSEAVAVVSILVTAAILICHFDRITALERVYVQIFKPKSKIELCLILFLVLWWSIAVGISTTITGIAGDGKQQFSLYYSAWMSCLCSYWILENWWVDYGWASFKSFISSWPYRAPAWICILFLSSLTMIWYVDLYKNYPKLTTPSELYLYTYFDSIPNGQWEWLICIAVLTLLPSIAFVLIELFRDIRPDGSNERKTQAENIVEGVTFFVLVLAWIPSVAMATTPGGIASLIGNAYFTTWLLVVFVFEGLVWWIHDYRVEIHQSLREKAKEYRKHQRRVLEKTQGLRTAASLDDEEEERARQRRRKEQERDEEETESDGGGHEVQLSEAIPNTTNFGHRIEYRDGNKDDDRGGGVSSGFIKESDNNGIEVVPESDNAERRRGGRVGQGLPEDANDDEFYDANSL